MKASPKVAALCAQLAEHEARLPTLLELPEIHQRELDLAWRAPPPFVANVSYLPAVLARRCAPARIARVRALLDIARTRVAIEMTRRELGAVIFAELVAAGDPDALACDMPRVVERVKEHLRAAQEAWGERADGNEARRQRELAARVIGAAYAAQGRLRERYPYAGVGEIPTVVVREAFEWINSVENNSTPRPQDSDRVDTYLHELAEAEEALAWRAPGEKLEGDPDDDQEDEAEPEDLTPSAEKLASQRSNGTPSKIVRDGVERDPRKGRQGRQVP
jgi:hypothetical protein